MPALSFEPHNQERFTQRGKTTLFYTNIDYHIAHKGYPPPVLVKGQMLVQMPALGEAIIFDEVYAEDIIIKTRYRKDKESVARSAFTRLEDGGQEMAQYIKDAIARKVPLTEIGGEMTKLKFGRTLATVADDTLIEALRERFPDAPQELLELLKSDRASKPVEKEVLPEGPAVTVDDATLAEMKTETGQPSVAGLYKQKQPIKKGAK